MSMGSAKATKASDAAARTQKKGRHVPALLARIPPGSGRRDLVGLQAFLALHDLEADLLAFLQALEARATDGTEMHEDVGATLPADEAKALGVVEPLDGTDLTIRHDTLRSVKSKNH